MRLRPFALSLSILASGCATPSPAAFPIAPTPVTSTSDEDPGQSIANPTESGFQDYLSDFKPRVLAAGVSEATWSRAMADVHLNRKVLDLSQSTPPNPKNVWHYRDWKISADDAAYGRKAMAANAKLFAAMARTYGVDPAAVASIWGNETGYGRVLGSFYVPETLATLAYEGRRRAFFENELIASLKLIQGGDTLASMHGSYAGALGQVQFMPSNIISTAVDADHDGRLDIRGSLPDAVYSCAQFLLKAGWKPGEPWMAEAALPAGFHYEQADLSVQKSLSEWAAQGVTLQDGRPLTAIAPEATMVSVIVPGGKNGAALIAFSNFRRFMDYNPSIGYAISVSDLANQLAGNGPIRHPWPADDPNLHVAEIIEMQGILQRLGYPNVTPDGRPGAKTRAAIRAYQVKNGIVADGFPTLTLLGRLRREGVS